MMKSIKVNDRKQRSLSEIDRIIHEPSRYNIMAILYVAQSADFLFLMRYTRLTGGNLSAHIRKLEGSGYISIKKEFLNNKPHTTIHLTVNGRKAFKQYRKNIKQTIATLPDIKSAKSK